MQGIVFDRIRTGPVSEEWDGQFAIAALAASGVEVTYMTDFDPQSSGAEVWQPFSATGACLTSHRRGQRRRTNGWRHRLRFTLAPGEKESHPDGPFLDLPVVQFGEAASGCGITPSSSMLPAPTREIARTALRNNQNWSNRLMPGRSLTSKTSPSPCGTGVNCSTNSTSSRTAARSGPTSRAARRTAAFVCENADSFAYLECLDYAYYGTSDVRFYGSFPLIKFWPEIEKQEMREYTDTIPESISQRYLWSWKLQHDQKFETMQRKVAGSAPHDLGSPTEDPFVNVNQYNYQDVSNWRDLNSKYFDDLGDYVWSGNKDDNSPLRLECGQGRRWTPPPVRRRRRRLIETAAFPTRPTTTGGPRRQRLQRQSLPGRASRYSRDTSQTGDKRGGFRL